MPININIILCDTFPGLLPQWIPSYVLMFTSMFDAAAGERKLGYTVFEAMNGELPSEFRTDEIYLITGCNLGVYDDIGWIKDLIRNFADNEPESIKLAALESLGRMEHQGHDVAGWILRWCDER